jgi:hypothetical protein
MPEHALTLILLPDEYSVCRLLGDAHLPESSQERSDDFLSITRTRDELSIICATSKAPVGAHARSDGWRCLKVKGPLDFSLTGVLHAITAPLAREKLSLLAVATFDTDYVLVRSAELAQALSALTRAGHEVREFNAAGGTAARTPAPPAS